MSSLRSARRAALAALVVLLASGLARAEVPPLSKEQRDAQATHVVVGRVNGVFRAERLRGPGFRDDVFVAEVSVSAVEKGEGAAPGRVLYACWWRASARPDGWAGPGGMNVNVPVGSTVRLWLARDDRGAFDVLRPNGAEVLERGSAAAEAPARPTPPPAAPLAETPESLAFETSRLVGALRRGDDVAADAAMRAWLLPDARTWFVAAFGADRGGRGAEEYAGIDLARLRERAWALGEAAARDPLRATEAPADDGRAAKVRRHLVRPVRLFTVEAGGTSLGFFVFEAGTWRLAGPMRAASEN